MLGTIIPGAIVLAVVTLIVRKLYNDHKNGKTCGDCAGCRGCAVSEEE